MGKPQLPPGQRERSDLPRFGLPAFVVKTPNLPDQIAIEVVGDVATPTTLVADDFARLQRVDQCSDFHCVTTWTRSGIRWGGYRFRDVLEQLIVPVCRPATEAHFVRVRGVDGFCAVLPLSDLLADDVLLVDQLEGGDLGFDHGAPIRLVAPAHYGYKSVKHLVSIELSGAWRRGSALLEHPRARVALEERGTRLPQWLLRYSNRTSIPFIVRLGRRASKKARRRSAG